MFYPYRRRRIRRITFPVRLLGGLLLIVAALGIGILARAAPPRVLSSDALHPLPVTAARLQPQLAPAQPSPLTTADDAAAITLVAWNTGLDDADPVTIASRIAAFDGVDLWALEEVNRPTAATVFEAAAEDGENTDFGRVLGTSGGGMHLLALYDKGRFDLLESYEIDPINTTGNARAPLVLHLRDKVSGEQFLFMMNHLYRSRDAERYKQAQLLNAWAAGKPLPIIAAGDYNFDWDVQAGAANHDQGFDLLTAGGRWQWVRPASIVTTQCSGWPCTDNSVVDFVFTAGPAQAWRTESEIVVAPNDFPDTTRTSDHRPILARLWLHEVSDDASNTPAPTATSLPAAFAIANHNANLRAGPGINYALAGSVAAGQGLSLAGRNAAGDWVQLDDGRWIAAFLVDGAPPAPAVGGAAVAVQSTATPVIVPTPVQRVQAPVVMSGNCDPSYLGVCIPSPPPDLDCGDVPYRRFVVVGSDPHRFDADRNGVGCEQ